MNGGRVDIPGSTAATSFNYDAKSHLLSLTDVSGAAVANIKFNASLFVPDQQGRNGDVYLAKLRAGADDRQRWCGRSKKLHHH